LFRPAEDVLVRGVAAGQPHERAADSGEREHSEYSDYHIEVLGFSIAAKRHDTALYDPQRLRIMR